MATSGTTIYTQNRNEIIRSAYELVGIAIDGEALNADDIDVAQKALNIMVKAWMAHGLQLWKRDSLSITLIASTNTYTIGATGGTVAPRPLRIIECDREDTSGTSTSMSRMTLEGYDTLPNKTQEGVPVSYFYDPSIPNGTLKVWPTPSTATAAEYTIDMIVQSPFEDLTLGTHDVDFPQEWLEAIIYGLAVRLAPRSDLNNEDRITLKQEAKDILDLALSFDVEMESVYFQPKL